MNKLIVTFSHDSYALFLDRLYKAADVSWGETTSKEDTERLLVEYNIIGECRIMPSTVEFENEEDMMLFRMIFV